MTLISRMLDELIAVVEGCKRIRMAWPRTVLHLCFRWWESILLTHRQDLFLARLVCAWLVVLATALISDRANAQNSAGVSHGNQSPVVISPGNVEINYQTVNVAYSPAGLEVRQQLQATQIEVQKIAPELEAALGVRLNRVLSEQRRQGKQLSEIKDLLVEEIRAEFSRVNAKLNNQVSAGDIVRELRRALYQSSTELRIELNVAPEARCGRRNDCVRLSYEGNASSVAVNIQAAMYSDVVMGTLDVDSVTLRCQDVTFPYAAVHFEELSNAPVTRQWVSGLRLLRSGPRNSRFRGTLYFTPQAACNNLQVVVQVINSSGEIHESTKSVTVESTSALFQLTWVAEEMAGANFVYPVIKRRVDLSVDARHVLPFLVVPGRTGTFKRQIEGIFTLDGSVLLGVGRTLHSRLADFGAPPPLSQERYREILSEVPWDRWGFGVLGQGDSFQKLSERTRALCEEIAQRFTASVDEVVSVARWRELCRPIAAQLIADVFSRSRVPASLVASFSSQYPSRILTFAGGVQERDGWTHGWRSGLRPRVPSHAARELIYVKDSAVATERGSIEVTVYGQPNLWMSTTLGVRWEPNPAYRQVFALAVPLAWDALELRGELGANTASGLEGAGVLRFSLFDILSFVLDRPEARQLVLQAGPGLAANSEADGAVFFDIFAGWALEPSRSSALRTRLGINGKLPLQRKGAPSFGSAANFLGLDAAIGF